MDLSKRLRMLASDETIIVPEEDIIVEDQDGNPVQKDNSYDIEKEVDKLMGGKKKSKKKNKNTSDFSNHDKYDKVIEEMEKKLKGQRKNNEDDDDEYIFDLIMESFDGEDEDSELKNSLLSMGRKYARETSISPETSAMQKLFSTSEKKLNNMIAELELDKEQLKEDLKYLHSTRSRNAKAISDLANTRANYYNIQLGLIKEINSMKKTMVELEMKLKSANKENEDIRTTNGNLISDLFSMRRKDLMGGIGGYTGISGSESSDENEEKTVASIENEYNDDDNYIQEHYMDDNEEEEDGDKFLKYRNDNVRYVLDMSSGEKEIYAEDGEGNRIEDYPMPSNIEDLTFEVDEKEHTATDDLHRTYIYRT